MKEMKNWINRLILLALLVLPFAASSCSDDEGPFVGVSNLGMEDGATVNVGQKVELQAQVSNMEGAISYRWTLNGEEVETDEDYTFIPSQKGSYSIELTVTGSNGTFHKSITLNVHMYPSKFYVVNEGQMGVKKGNVNKYNQGEWTYNFINGGCGDTSTDIVIHNEYMYVTSKTSPFLVKTKLADASITDKLTDGLEKVQAQSFCIVNDEVGVLTTSNGAYRVNLNNLSDIKLLPQMEQIKNDMEDSYKAGSYIFIITQNKIQVYNADDLTFHTKLNNEVNTGFALSKDGSLWAANNNKLVRINVGTLETEEITLPEDLNVYYNSLAYTPTGLSASTTENALYFVKKTGEGWSIYGKDIYKYDIDQKKATKFFEAPKDDKSVYGAGISVNPENGDVYIVYTEDGWGTHYLNTNIYVADGKTGSQKAIIDYTGEYWFPSKIVF